MTFLRSCISYSLCPAEESEIPGSDISSIVGHIRWFFYHILEENVVHLTPAVM